MIKFWKLHGCGNDFIAVDAQKCSINDYSEFAKFVCHRNFGVGADGLLIAQSSNNASCKMIYYNCDGSIANMCGNGIRCFSKFVYENNIVNKDEFTVETLDGIKNVKLIVEDDKVISVTVNMGRATINPKHIPVLTDKSEFVNEKIHILDRQFEVTTVLVGVPHTVIYVDDINIDDVIKYGREIEKCEKFPQKTNVNFVKVVDESNIIVSTFERGCGYTLACGSGICASSYVSYKLKKTSDNLNVKCEGGNLKIQIIDENIYMSALAKKICEGILEE